MKGSFVFVLLLAVVALSACHTGTTPETQNALNAISTAEDTAATTYLETAAVTASVYVASNGSYGGFSAEVARGFEPSIQWADGGTPRVGGVSIRGVTDTGLVLVTGSESGQPLCLGVAAATQSKGQVDAQTPEDCTGGW